MEECLPPELQTRIFSHLPSRRDIAASRLVSKQFLACSSRFLVPRVVIAKRLDSLRQLWQILQHPSLRKHVTELVWDASGYSESIASDFENYIQACDGSGRDFRDQTSIEEDDRYTSLCSEAGLECSPLPWQDLDFHEMENYEDNHMYAAGMHKGYDEYFRRWRYQIRIEEDGVRFHMLRAALQRLPRLRRIVFTDFSELAGPKELHHELCGRLFGNTLEPVGLISNPTDTDPELIMLKSILGKSQKSGGKDISIPVRIGVRA